MALARARGDLEIITDSWALYRAHFEPLVLSGLIVGVAWAALDLLSAAMLPELPPPPQPGERGDGAGVDPQPVDLGGLFLFLTAKIIASYVGAMFITLVLLLVELPAAPAGAAALWAVFRRALVPILATSVVSLAVKLTGLFLFIVPGLVFLVIFFFAEHVALVERRAGWGALMRAKQLSDGRHLRNLYLLVTVFFLFLFAPGLLALALLAGLPGDGAMAVVRLVLNIALFGLIHPLYVTAVTLVFLDVLAQREGVDDKELTRRLLGGGAAPSV